MLVGLCLLIVELPASAGVVIGATRIVMEEQVGQQEVYLRATGKHAYLVVANVLPAAAREQGDSAAKVEGVQVLPPALVMRGGQERQLRILANPKHGLPRDRESLLYLTVSAIPEGNKEKQGVQIAVRTWIKLFYRPGPLAGKAIPALRIARDGDDVVMKNASPFYVSLSGVVLAGRPVVSPGDVPPFGEKRFTGCVPVEPCELRWQQMTKDNQWISYAVAAGN